MGMTGTYVATDESTIQKILAKQLSAIDFLYDKNNELPTPNLNIDKSWDAMHFTLTGTMQEVIENEPLSKVVLGGKPLDPEADEDSEHFYFTISDVKEANTALQSISTEDFKAKWDFAAQRKNNVYPMINVNDADNFLEYFVKIKEFYDQAAQQSKCIIFFIA